MFVRLWPRGDAGVFDFYLDGQLLVQSKDLYAEHHFATDLKLGHMHKLTKGSHTVKAVYRGTGERGGAPNLFVDAIVLEPVGQFEKKPVEPAEK